MPVPVSLTSRRTPPPSARAHTVIVPPFGIASTALKIRLASISRMPAASPGKPGTSVTRVSTRIAMPCPSA